MADEEIAKFATWLKGHPGLVVAISPVVLAILKVMSSSRFVMVTQLEIVAAADPASILIGTTVTLLPSAVGVLLFSSMLGMRSSALVKRLAVVGLAFSSAAMLLLPFRTRVVPAVLSTSIVIAIVWALFRGRSDVEKVALVAVSTLILSASTTGVWLPLEKLSIGASSEEALVGYVLHHDGERVSVLIEETRLVEHFDSSQLIDRAPCRQRDIGRSLYQIATRRSPANQSLVRCASDP